MVQASIDGRGPQIIESVLSKNRSSRLINECRIYMTTEQLTAYKIAALAADGNDIVYA